MNFFARIRAALSRFMLGRYGTDSLNQFLTLFWLVLAVLNLIFRSVFLSLMELILCFSVFFRMLSKNIIKRQKENADWYRFSTKMKHKIRHLLVRFKERKTTRFFSCPHCKASIRMPRKIGRFQIRCQKCGNTFVKEFKK